MKFNSQSCTSNKASNIESISIISFIIIFKQLVTHHISFINSDIMDQEKLLKALSIIEDFKGENLKIELDSKAKECKGKSPKEIKTYETEFKAALTIKNASAQINEIVHALGIINCLPIILQEDERVESLSLASGAAGDGIDLVTNYRIAEFKFSRWQEGKSANGARRRQIFKDLVSLYLNKTNKKKELYTYDKEHVEKISSSKKAEWRTVLSKSGKIKNELESHLKCESLSCESLYDIYSISNVKLIDISNIIKL